MKAKIYTKTGDQGQTSLVGGARVPKTHVRIEAYGSLDELNSVVGIIRTHVDTLSDAGFKSTLQARLQSIQNSLFNIGSQLACEKPEMRSQLPQLKMQVVADLEKDMDEWETSLPPLKNFILPGGSSLSSFTHLGRTVCRRSEREMLKLKELDPTAVGTDMIQFINRLSDWFFLLARKANGVLKIQDVQWDQN